MLHIKFDQDWPTGFRELKFEGVKDSSLKASDSKVNSLIRPESKRVQAFMSVMVTSNFDDDSIKNERASMETAYSHYK